MQRIHQVKKVDFSISSGSLFDACVSDITGAKCIEFPASFGYNDLKVFKKKDDEVPSKFAWTTGKRFRMQLRCF